MAFGDFNGDDFDDLYICNRTGKDIVCIGDPEALITSTTDINISKEVLVFPNPVNDLLTIRLLADAIRPISFHLFDIRGKLVSELQPSVDGLDYQVNLGSLGLTSGWYSLKVIDEQGVVSSKLIELR